MSGGGTKTVQTTQNTTREPWGPQQEYLQQAFRSAGERLPGALDTVEATRPVFQSAANVFGNAAANPALGEAANTAGGINRWGALNPVGQSYLTAAARGDFLTQNNPFFERMVDQSVQAARPSLDAAFASSGRFGSGAYANAFADAATRRSTELGYQDYGRERALQAQAANALNQFGLSDAGMRLQAAQALPGLLGAPGDMYARQATAMNAPNMMNWENLGAFRNIIGPAIEGNSSSVGTQPVQQANPLLQGIGAASGAAGGLGQLFSAGAGGTSAAANIGTGIASLFSVFSDARVKDDIQRVGQLDNGLPVYSYRYKGQPQTQIGLMAQDVAQVKPEAVSDMGGGILGVDYRQAIT